MADIELIIKMDKKDYEIMKHNVAVDNPLCPLGQREMVTRIANGTPLPEGCDIQRIIPKKVNVQKWTHTECPNPNCNHELSTHHYDGYYFFKHKPNFCPNCGQTLLWESEAKEEAE